MFQSKHIFVLSVLTLAFICLSSLQTLGQDVPNYLYLQVVDSNQEPVRDATVSLANKKLDFVARGNSDKGIRKTNREGYIQFVLPHITNDNSTSLLKISKTGYFDFFDLGIPMRPRDWLNFTVELFKVPQTENERKKLGDEQIKREFMWAVKSGDAQKVQKYLRLGLNPNLTTDNLRGVPAPKGVPAIVFAVLSTDHKTVKTLLKAGADLKSDNAQTKNVLANYLLTYPPMTSKQTFGKKNLSPKKRLEMVKLLVKNGANFSTTEGYLTTPVTIAAMQNSPKILKFLLENGISPDSRDRFEVPLLIHAIGYYYERNKDRSEIVNILLEKGANPNVRAGRKLYTPLMLAVQKGDIELIKALISRGADVNAHDITGETPLMYVTNQYKPNPEISLRMAKILLEAGADPNAWAIGYNGVKSKKTPLMNASGRGNLELMRLLIKSGAEINFDLGKGDSALGAAVRGGKPIEATKLLVEAGADVKGKFGTFALKIVKMTKQTGPNLNYMDIVKLLESYGASDNQNN